jgi:DNA-binding beta-propeller fold protein YncE
MNAFSPYFQVRMLEFGYKKTPGMQAVRTFQKDLAMKEFVPVIVAVVLELAMGGMPRSEVSAQQSTPRREPMVLTNRVSLPGVVGRLDHFTIDNKHRRVIVAGLGNNTVEVVGGFSLRDIHSIPGQDGPQGVLYVPEIDKLVVANEGGKVNIYEGDKYEFVKALDFDGADNLRYDPAAKLIYVSFADGIGMIDAKTLERLPTVYKFPEQPESYQLEKNGPRIFVNLPNANSVAVLDRKTGERIATWKVTDARTNFAMLLDEADHRLFSVFRNPSTIMVFDTESGKIIARLPCVVDVDDIWYEPTTKRLYVSGGEGFVDVFHKVDADHYERIGKVPTFTGARTSVIWGEYRARQGMVIGVPATSNQGAELWFTQFIDY